MRARACELALRQCEDEEIAAVLTREFGGSSRGHLALMAEPSQPEGAWTDELEDFRATGRALLRSAMWTEATSGGKNAARMLEWLSRQHLGHTQGGIDDDVRKMLQQLMRLKPDELVARLEAMRDRGLKVA